MKTIKDKKSKLGIKLCIIGFISLLLLIPQTIIRTMIMERESMSEAATEESTGSWGGACEICGPILFIPGDNTNNKNHNVYIMPENLEVDAVLNTQQLHRGNYDFTVFDTPLKMSGSFVLPKEFDRTQLNHLKLDRAQILFAVSDFKGFVDYPNMLFDGSQVDLENDDKTLGNFHSLSCVVDVSKILVDGESVFEINVDLKGSQQLSIVPVGRASAIRLKGNCVTPSFKGYYLPISRKVDDSGFTAEWKVLGLNRDFPQVVSSQADLAHVGTVAVGLNVPVDQYQQTERSIKYAYLIILLTFVVVFMVEYRRQTPIHSIQYALVGAALVLFYTLLLSFSEHMAFGISYLIASAMTVGLITIFIGGIVKHRGAAFAIGGLLSALYLFIFIIMQLETYALLVGSLGVFVILAVAMFVSQKINWYHE